MRLLKTILTLLLAYFTIRLLTGSEYVLFDNINLIFHEAGHTFLLPFGQTFHFLGGTIGQLAVPVALATYFFFSQRDVFASLVCFWWVGQNLVNIAYYIADAPYQRIQLIGGTHDWAFLLGQWNLVGSSELIGGGVRLVGFGVMLSTLAVLGCLSLVSKSWLAWHVTSAEAFSLSAYNRWFPASIFHLSSS